MFFERAFLHKLHDQQHLWVTCKQKTTYWWQGHKGEVINDRLQLFIFYFQKLKTQVNHKTYQNLVAFH